MSSNSETAPSGSDPILVDLGKRSKKSIKLLRGGEGKLMAEVRETLDELKANGTVSPSAQMVIVIVKEKRKSMGRLWPLP